MWSSPNSGQKALEFLYFDISEPLLNLGLAQSPIGL